MEIPLELIHKLPKTDLHVHLDGSLRPDTLLELGRQNGVQLPFSTLEETHAYMRQHTGTDLKLYLSVFDTLLSVLQTREALHRVAFELAEDAARENVRYMEVRFSPILHEHAGLTWPEIVEAVLEGLREAEERYVIGTGVIICGIRTISPEMSLQLADLTVSFKGKGVVGFDLAGAEKAYPAKDHKEAFYTIRNNNISGTIHAGDTMTRELDLACSTFHLDTYDLRKILINGFKSSFLPYREKVKMLSGAIDEMDRLFEEYFPGTYRRLRSFL
jgi:adenosine deaminase